MTEVHSIFTHFLPKKLDLYPTFTTLIACDYLWCVEHFLTHRFTQHMNELDELVSKEARCIKKRRRHRWRATTADINVSSKISQHCLVHQRLGAGRGQVTTLGLSQGHFCHFCHQKNTYFTYYSSVYKGKFYSEVAAGSTSMQGLTIYQLAQKILSLAQIYHICILQKATKIPPFHKEQHTVCSRTLS